MTKEIILISLILIGFITLSILIIVFTIKKSLQTYRQNKAYLLDQKDEVVFVKILKQNISKAYYWQIEHKNRRLSYEMAKEIAKIFNLKPDDIFYDEYGK